MSTKCAPNCSKRSRGSRRRQSLLAAERAQLLRQLADRTTEPAALLERLRDLADALEGAGVSVAVHTSGRLRTSSARRAHRQRAEALLTAADRFARDGGTATGLLAVGLVNGTGTALGWPEEWRSVLRLLRGHANADGRHEAYRTMTENE